ncbi:hypothetical protein ACLX1H_007006 [Fusarium chlamydosporum]
MNSQGNNVGREGHRDKPAHHFDSVGEFKDVALDNLRYHSVNYLKDKGHEAKEFFKSLKNHLSGKKEEDENEKNMKVFIFLDSKDYDEAQYVSDVLFGGR